MSQTPIFVVPFQCRNSNKNRDDTTNDQTEKFEFRKFSNTPEKEKRYLEVFILIVKHLGDPSVTNWNIRDNPKPFFCSATMRRAPLFNRGASRCLTRKPPKRVPLFDSSSFFVYKYTHRMDRKRERERARDNGFGRLCKETGRARERRKVRGGEEERGDR